MLILENKNSKLSERPQKLPEKSVPEKFHQKSKTLPGKTKFTLQYDAGNGHGVKCTDEKGVRSLTPKQSRTFGSSRPNLTVSGVQAGRGKPVRDQSSSQVNSKGQQLSDERNISAYLRTTSLTMGADSKPFVTATRRFTKISAPVKAPTDSKVGLTSSKPECKHNTIQKCAHSQGKTDTKATSEKIGNVKKPTNFQSGIRAKESEKSIKSLNCACNKSLAGYKSPECHIRGVQSTKPDGETRSMIPERTRKMCEERKVVAKERSRSQEIKRIAPEESSAKPCENAKRKRSEGKIIFEKSTLYFGDGGRNWENGNVSPDCQEKASSVDSLSPAPRSLSKGCLIPAKQNIMVMQDPGDNLMKNKSTANMVDIGGNSINEDTIFRSYSSRPVEDYLGPESLERIRRDDELLSLDKRIWSNLEVEIRETCEKTDILCDSGDDSGDSELDIIHQLFSNEDDEALLDCLRKSELRVESRKYPEYREEWCALSVESKSKPELWKEFSEKENEKVEPRTNSFERPKSRRAIEESFGRKISQESKRTKSSEDSKIRDSKHEFRTKSLSGDIKWTNLRDDTYGKGTKERKTVNFLDYKIGSKCVSSSFFHTHKNVGFIGKDVDEEYVSFEPGQVTLYQPHESHMLLYDIANCAATQGYLKMCGITYDVVIRKNAEQMSPSGRVPFISSGFCIIPEFEAIVSFMQYKKYACIPVKENDKPAFRAIFSMIIDILETAERYICWYDDSTLLNYTRPRIGGQYPFPLNHIMHWKKRHEERSRLTESGYSGRSFDLILSEISSCFRTLSRRLGNNHFFFGNTGTEVDALVYGHVYALFTTEVDGPFRDLQFIIQQYPNLVSFAFNFDKTFCLHKFPSHELSYWDNILTDGRYASESSFSPKA